MQDNQQILRAFTTQNRRTIDKSHKFGAFTAQNRKNTTKKNYKKENPTTHPKKREYPRKERMGETRKARGHGEREEETGIEAGSEEQGEREEGGRGGAGIGTSEKRRNEGGT